VEGDRHAEALGDPLGEVDHDRRRLRLEHPPRRGFEQGQPALEMGVRQLRHHQMRPERMAVVAVGAQQHRRPERAHLVQMDRPALRLDPAQEHRADQVVGAHRGIEAVDQRMDALLVDAGARDAAESHGDFFDVIGLPLGM
jgi:hypothetical protein